MYFLRRDGIASWFRATCAPSSAVRCERRSRSGAWREAYVDRNVFRSNYLAGSSPARFATALQRSRHPGIPDSLRRGKYEIATGAAGVRLKQLDQLDGDRHLSLLPALGVRPNFCLAVTRTVCNSKLTSVQNRCTTSSSRKPVNRNVEKSTFSLS